MIINLIKKNITGIFIVFYLSVALVNDGFMGTDEYWNAMVKYLPAQTSKITQLVAEDDVKSPLQVMPMFLGSQLALKIGITHPYEQYHFTIVFLTLISILIYLFCFHLFRKYKNWLYEDDDKIFIGLMTFYFASSFALTRPMFEALGAPWLLLSCALFLKYQNTKSNISLILSTLAVSMGFILRQQTGIGALTIPILLLYSKDFKGLWIASITGLVAFVISGIPDVFLRGKFHQSLIAVTTYNMEHGHEYGNSSVFYYPIMLFIMGFIPFYFSKKITASFIKNNLVKQKFSLIFVILFVALHSYFPQKFERFLISIIPLILVLMTPFVGFLLRNFKTYKIRLTFLFLINFSVLFAASFQPSQGNIINLSLFIDKHPGINNVLNFEKTLEWIPEKFITNNHNYHIIDINQNQIGTLDPKNCSQVIVINEFLYEKDKYLFKDYKIKDQFNVNFIESIAYKLNRKNNIRRSSLIVLGCPDYTNSIK
ncbi:MAG: hypothetical protein KDD45_03065 [Bdellovibrionales bacterium]|nr:hypothetical protein [Bdellovibrionales bacterium]